MKITLFILQKGHEFQVRCGIGWTRVDQEWTRADQGGLRRTRADQGGLGGPRRTRLAKGGLGQPRAAQGGPGWTRADQGGFGRSRWTRMNLGGLGWTKSGLGRTREALEGLGWTRADQGGLGRPSQTRIDGLGGPRRYLQRSMGVPEQVAKFNSKLSKMHLDFKNMPQQYMLSQGDRVLESGPKKIKTTHLNKRHMRLQFIDCNQNLKVYLELVLVWPPRPPKAALVCPRLPQGIPSPPYSTSNLKFMSVL